MILIFVLAIISDIVFYMMIANFVTHAEFGSGVITLTPLVVMAIAAASSYMLNNIRPVLRFLPILLLSLCFHQVQNAGAFLLMLLPCLYLSLNIFNKNFVFDIDRLRQKILLCMKLSFLPLIAVIFRGYEYLIAVYYFHFLFVYFVCAIYLMRVTRADIKTISNPKFIIINLATVIGSLALLSLLGSPQVMRLLLQGLRFVYFNFVIHILLFAANVVIGFLALIGFDRFVENLSQNAALRDRTTQGSGADGYFIDVSEAAMRTFLGIYAVQWVFIIALVAAAIFVFMKLMNKQGQNYSSKGIISISSVFSEESRNRKKQGLFAPKDPRAAIRYHYCKFLNICTEKGQPASKGDTSEDINENNQDCFSNESMSRLRALYIKARYSEHVIESKEGKEAGELVKRL